jgi:hypothetical protein
MTTCVFCGSHGGSEEHIIADSVRSRAQIAEHEIEVGVREDEGDGPFRKPHRMERFVTHQVCGDCNQSWMSRSEVDFLDVAGALIEPKWPQNAHMHMERCAENSDIIRRWGLKTAITANLAGIIRRPFPEEIPAGLYRGDFPATLRLRMTRIVERRPIEIIINRGFWFLEGDERRWKGAESGRSFDVLFQLNHLAIRLINAPSVILGYEPSVRSLSAQARSSEESILSFDSLEQFEKTLVARLPNSR